MYLSKLILNEREGYVHRELGNAHALHQRIMQAFPDEQRLNPRQDWNVLYRHEPDSLVVLVQSDLKPDWSRLPLNYFAEPCCEPKPLIAIAGTLAVGRVFQFRLKANPSKRDKQSGKTIGLNGRENQLAWLVRQSQLKGFTVHSVDVVSMPDLVGRKKTGLPPIRIQAVLFQGVLEIADVRLFEAALRCGIGRGRSYGCGLLSLARLRSS